VQSTDVLDRLTNVAVPLICCEPALFDDLRMTGPTWMSDMGDVDAQKTIQITAPTHPLAGGLTGLTSVVSADSRFVWGVPAAAATKVATIAGQANHAAIFAYEKAVSRVGMTAPERRVGWFANRAVPAQLNENGWQRFEAAVSWAAQLPTVASTSTVEFVDMLSA